MVQLRSRFASPSEPVASARGQHSDAGHRFGRRLTAGAGLAAVALLAFGPAAVAEVDVSPAEAGQGSAAALTLQVRNERPGVFTTKVEVQFPQDNPVAEVYPMSVPNWAPLSTSRTLAQPIQGVHDSGVTEVTSAITWIRTVDAPKAAAMEELKLELGPLPTQDELKLTVIQTYSDGTVERLNGPGKNGPGTVLKLVPAAGAEAATGHGAVHPGAVAPTAATKDNGNTAVELGLIGAGVVAGMLVSALAVVTIGNRRRTDRGEEEPPEDATPDAETQAKDAAEPKADARA